MEEKQSTVSESETESNSPPAVSRTTAAQAVRTALSLGNAGTTEAVTPGNVDSLAKMKGKMPEKRPREYDAEGNLILSSAGVQPPEEQLGTTPFSSSSSSSKRGRGRPPAGDRQRLESIGKESKTTAAGTFKPFVLTVKTGEDVAGKILSFAQMVPGRAFVISANGAVSKVTIRQPGSSGGIMTYEGQFEILTLSGPLSFIDDVTPSALRVSLGGPDGHVIAGITDSLTAAHSFQLVLGSIIPNGNEEHKRKQRGEYALASPLLPANPDTVIAAIPISQREDGGIQPGLTLTPPSLLPQTLTEATRMSQAKPDVIQPGLTLTPPSLLPQTLTEATRMSQAKPDVIQPGLEWLRGHTAGRDNQIGPSHFAGWNGSEARPDRGQFPHNNVPFPAIAGGELSAYVVTVAPGENIESKLHSLAQTGPGGICVLSATGTVSEAKIYQPVASGYIERFCQARFEILSLFGFYAFDDALTWRGGMSVVLSAPDGSYFVNGMARLVIAAGPVKLVVRTFKPNQSTKEYTHWTQQYPPLPPTH